MIFEIHDAVVPLAGSTPVRRTIVEKALGYLERLAGEAQGNTALRSSWRALTFGLGGFKAYLAQRISGDREGATQSFRKAQTLIEPLARSPNPAPEPVEQYVEATRRLSEVLLPNAEQRDEAGREAQKALAVASAFHRQRPADVKARNLLASSSFTAAMAAPSQRRSPPGKGPAGFTTRCSPTSPIILTISEMLPWWTSTSGRNTNYAAT